MTICVFANVINCGGRDGVGSEDATMHYTSYLQKLNDIFQLFLLVFTLSLSHSDNNSLLMLCITQHP